MTQSLVMDDPRAFSAIAEVYDADYSSQLTIRLQRRIYWQYLAKYLVREHMNVLDMNCGTGTDAVHMIESYTDQQHVVTGIDISPKMIGQFNAKSALRGLEQSMRGVQSPLQRIEDLDLGQFDLITSNFGGLNCLTEDELRSLSIDLHDRFTKPGARVVAVVMPNFCLWETAYFLAKGKSRAAFRRLNDAGVSANIGGSYIRTYYYSPRKFGELMEGFEVERITPLGLFLPPSYIDNFFRRHRSLARVCAGAEQALGNFSLPANLSDHYIIELVRA